MPALVPPPLFPRRRQRVTAHGHFPWLAQALGLATAARLRAQAQDRPRRVLGRPAGAG